MAGDGDLDSLVVPVEGLDLEEKIGVGAFGVIYKVTVRGKVCAAKTPPKVIIHHNLFYARGNRDSALRKFRNECRTLSKLNHPNVVGFVGIHYKDDNLYLIMEMLQTDLHRYLSEKPHCQLSDKIHILHDVSKGLLYLHNLSPPLIHFDLTAFNILLTKDLNAKIGDLGVSKYANELWDDHPFFGGFIGFIAGGIGGFGGIGGLFTERNRSQYYLPPEYNFRWHSTLSTKLDIFSFGNLIIHTVNSEVPNVCLSKIFNQENISDFEREGKLELLKRDHAIHSQMGVSHCLYPLVVGCLHDEPDHRPSAKEVEITLKGLCTKNPQQVTILKQLMNDKNAVKVQYSKVFFIGPPGVGKTLTRLRLCNEMENMISRGSTPLPESTLLANFNQVLIYINSRDGQNTWITSNNSQEEAQILFRYMCMLDPKNFMMESVNETDPSDDQNVDVGNVGDQPVVPMHQSVQRRFSKLMRAILQLRHRRMPPHISTVADEPNDESLQEPSAQSTDSETDDILSRLQDLVRNFDSSRFSELYESSILVNIHDIGGQPGFLEMIPSLISGPAAYLVFLNLSLPLDERYEIPFSRQSDSIIPFESIYTVKSTISQILTAISSINPLASPEQISTEFEHFKWKKPVATVVGTHLDKLEDGNAPIANLLKQKHQEIRNIIDNFCESGVVVTPAREESFVAIDNYKGTEESDLFVLRAHVMDLITKKLNVSIPIRPAWLILSIILRKEFEVVSLSTCFEIGNCLKMDQEETKTALWYLHNIVGAIMYYPEIEDEDGWFKTHIICSPQVIFDSISQVIVHSLQMLHSNSRVPACESLRRDWIEKGLFSIEAIREVTETNEITRYLPIEKLIKLLAHVNLLSEIKLHNPQPCTPSIQLFMPAILECASEKELSNPPVTDENHPAPIFLKFKFGYIPTGVFCCLVTRIVTKGAEKIFGELWELKKDNVKRNFISFYLSELHYVSLISHDTCYEIRVERRGTTISLHDLCSQVLTTILYLLKEAYQHLEPIIAFECACDKYVADDRLKHLCEISNVAICKGRDERHEVQLRDDQKVWMGKSTTLSAETEMRLLSSLPEKVTVHWIKHEEELCVSHHLHIQSVTNSHFGAYKVDIKQEEKEILSITRILFKQETLDLIPPAHPVPSGNAIEAIEVLKRRFKVNDALLDSEAIEHDLYNLAGCFDNYNDYLDKLGLTPAEQSDVRRVEFLEKSHQSAMREALRLWRKLRPDLATFRALLNIVLSMNGKWETAQNICKFIHEHVRMPYQD